MAVYKFTALCADGKTIKNKINCNDLNEFYKVLEKDKLYCVNVKEVNNSSFFVRSNNTVLKQKDMAVFSKQLSTMLSAGIQLSTAINILFSQTRVKKMKDILYKLYQANQKGLLFSEALKSLPNTFPPFFISMIEAGEASGNLDKTLLRLSVHYEKEATLKSKIIQAVTYPSLLVVVTFLIIIFIFTIIFPRLENLFNQNANLPPLTKVMMSISNLMVDKWHFLIVAFLSLLVFLPILYNMIPIRKLIDQIKLKVPFLGILNTTIVTARFSRTFSALEISGMDVIIAIEFSSNILNNMYLSEKLNEAITNIKKGETLSSSFKRLNIFPIMFITMVHVGEESGDLGAILAKTSDFYDADAESAIKRMVTLIQPIMILFMAAVVVLVIMSVMQPLYGGYNFLAL